MKREAEGIALPRSPPRSTDAECDGKGIQREAKRYENDRDEVQANLISVQW